MCLYILPSPKAIGYGETTPALRPAESAWRASRAFYVC